MVGQKTTFAFLKKKQSFQKEELKKEAFPHPLKQVTLSNLILNLIVVLLILLLNFLKKLPPEVPLFYSLPEGTEQLAPTLLLILPSSLVIGFTLLNFLFSLFNQEEFLKQVLAYSTLLLSFFSIITTIKIIFLVGNL